MLLCGKPLNIKKLRSGNFLASLEKELISGANQYLPANKVIIPQIQFPFQGVNSWKGGKNVNFTYEAPPAGKKYIFVTRITHNGHTFYASQYGLKAFRILVDA